MICIGMETKTRPSGHDYFDDTLANLRRSCHDDGTPVLVSFGDNFTRMQNGANAIRIAVKAAEECGAEWVMKLEDDLDFCDDFIGSVERWLAVVGDAQVGMFSLAYTFEQVSKSHFDGERTIFDTKGTSFPRARYHLSRGDQFVAVPVNAFWGAQALVWRTHVARELVNWLGEDPFFDDGKEQHRKRGHDLLLQQWMRDRKDRWFAAAVPSFVQHMGHHSNLDQPEIKHLQPFFQFPFAGRDWSFR